jgi:hypothetical protein
VIFESELRIVLMAKSNLGFTLKVVTYLEWGLRGCMLDKPLVLK